MRYQLLFFLVFAAISFSVRAQTHTISGYLKNATTGEVLIQAKVYAPAAQRGTTSNVDGFYSLTLDTGTYEILFSYLDFEKVSIQIALFQDTVINVNLNEPVRELQEVTVFTKKSENVSSTKMGQIELQMEMIKTLPAFMGEVDLLKTIQLLPGVSSASEGGQGFYVRGGGPDQNLVLLDGATVYNAAHLFGFFSVFNADAIKSVNLIKGGMPANFGGRMSSVLEVNMNEGNAQKLKVKGGLGVISSRLTFEGPLKKDKGSFIISGRRTYIDVLMKAAIPKTSNFYGSGYFFYDLNMKLHYRLGEKDQLFLSAYYGKDKFYYNNTEDGFKVEMPWGNGVAALRWNHVFGKKLVMNTTATYTNYQFSFGSDQDQFQFAIKSGISDLGGKVDFTYYLNTRNKLKWGVDYTFHVFTPTSIAASQEDVVFDTGLSQHLYSHETAFYLQDEFDLNEKLRIEAGLRYSMYQFVGPFTRYITGDISSPDSTITYASNKLIHFYDGLEPRLSVRWLLSGQSSIKAGYSYNYQYVHMVSMSAVSLPTDIWYPSTDLVKPQQGSQTSVGYYHNFKEDKYEGSVELYYKDMRNLIEFKEGSLPSDNVNDNTDNLLIFGRGWAYGIEFFLRKNVGKLTGWVGYTLSKTERQFSELNNGQKFAAKYDRRHDLSVVASYKLNERWTFGGAFVFATGNTMTLPTSWYVQNQDLLLNYGARNSTRMAPYHRLDISATLYSKAYKSRFDPVSGTTIQVKKKFRSNWAFSVYNVYNRANPYFLYIDSNGNFLSGDFQLSVKQVSLFPVLPSATWNVEF